VLKVAIIRNTRVLEVNATLPDAHLAQQAAKLVAGSTLDLSRSLLAEGDRDLFRGIAQEQSEIRASTTPVESW
jgi:hypothetical protein